MASPVVSFPCMFSFHCIFRLHTSTVKLFFKHTNNKSRIKVKKDMSEQNSNKNIKTNLPLHPWRRNEGEVSAVEKIKMASDGLRGTLAESLQDELTGAIREPDQALIKFHGMYQQDDRDVRDQRVAKKLEWLYAYMIRQRLPGSFFTPDQWMSLHHIAGEHSKGLMKNT